eukprot:6146656-Prymnesium_polylepis.2
MARALEASRYDQDRWATRVGLVEEHRTEDDSTESARAEGGGWAGRARSRRRGSHGDGRISR